MTSAIATIRPEGMPHGIHLPVTIEFPVQTACATVTGYAAGVVNREKPLLAPDSVHLAQPGYTYMDRSEASKAAIEMAKMYHFADELLTIHPPVR